MSACAEAAFLISCADVVVLSTSLCLLCLFARLAFSLLDRCQGLLPLGLVPGMQFLLPRVLRLIPLMLCALLADAPERTAILLGLTIGRVLTGCTIHLWKDGARSDLRRHEIGTIVGRSILHARGSLARCAYQTSRSINKSPRNPIITFSSLQRIMWFHLLKAPRALDCTRSGHITSDH